MFIETATKNIARERILINTNSEKISAMLSKVVSSYNNAPVSCSSKQREKLQRDKLNLQNSIQSNIAKAYSSGNPQVTHFYNTGYPEIPIWVLFEIMTMGDFGHLLSCLTFDVRDDISKNIGLNASCDTDRELLYKYIYALKDLRNAIAHNAVVFDARFRRFDPNAAMKQCLKIEIGLPYVNFNTIGDYILLTGYYLKLLRISKTEIKTFIREFERITNKYLESVNSNVSTMVVHSDQTSRIDALKNLYNFSKKYLHFSCCCII